MIASFLPQEFFPVLILMFGAILIPLLPGTVRKIYILALPVVAGLHFLSYPMGNYGEYELFNFSLTFMRLDGLSRIFIVIFFIATILNVIFAWYVDDAVQQTAGIVYPAAAMGGVLAGDFVTLFVFWEIAAIASVFLILTSRSERALRAASRYLVIQISSGVILLAGLILFSFEAGFAQDSMIFSSMELGSPATWALFLAFGIKSAFPLLHNWVQDAYPEGTVTGTIILSIFTTKLAVYSLARGFPGTELLIYIGATMTLFPIFFAVIEDNLRKVLTYSINNQVGFMVVAVGIGGTYGINGAAGYAFCNIIFEGLLFMSICAVLYRTGTSNASELGGLYKTMPLTTLFCIIGALSISAFPLFAGFVSKGIIIDGVAKEHLLVIWLILLFASAGVLEHAGIKIPYFAFFAHDSGKRVKEAPLSMQIAMGTSAIMCVAIGVFPDLLYNLLPLEMDSYQAYTTAHIVTQLQLLLFAVLAFVFLIKFKLYPPEIKSTNLDFDWFYRKPGSAVVRGVVGGIAAINGVLSNFVGRRIEGAIRSLYALHGPEGRLARTWPSGFMAMWIAILLTLALLVNYL